MVENLTWLRGQHSFKSGLDLRRFSLDFYLDLYARGQFTFVGLSGQSLADLLMGVPITALRQNPSMNSRTNLRTTAFNSYFQDDWRIRPDLTLNLGVRYEVNQTDHGYRGPLLDSRSRRP